MDLFLKFTHFWLINSVSKLNSVWQFISFSSKYLRIVSICFTLWIIMLNPKDGCVASCPVKVHQYAYWLKHRDVQILGGSKECFSRLHCLFSMYTGLDTVFFLFNRTFYVSWLNSLSLLLLELSGARIFEKYW